MGPTSIRFEFDQPGREYDCEAENSAYESAKATCSGTASSSDEYDENLHVVEGDEVDPLEAINSWSSEALDLNQAAAGNLYLSSYNISNFANLAWDTHTKFGCAVVKCDSGKIHLVCHYAPKVQKEGEQIYETGEPCAGCREDECFEDEGLCYKKL
ncbi:SCP-like protein [Ancylostoma duodenale]|uniref:SCP-like protein n=1 Tax=Ancylostoma duodenale TaxID=51022 RepID=A0A0C2DJI6_9BILA|nr:SCP-like protein [Ancylostoma duodenale]